MVEAHAVLTRTWLEANLTSHDPTDPIGEAHRQWVAHGWADAADGMAMVTSVVRAQQLLMERIDAVLRPRGLTFARYEVLRLLSFTRAAAMPMSRLGSLLQVHPTSVTSAVDRLVRPGIRGARARRAGPAGRTRGADRRRAARRSRGRRRPSTARCSRALGCPADDVRDLTDRLTTLRTGLGESL